MPDICEGTDERKERPISQFGNALPNTMNQDSTIPSEQNVLEHRESTDEQKKCLISGSGEVLPNKMKPNRASHTQYEQMPKLSIRFDGGAHMISYDLERKGIKCKLPGCNKQTPVFCEKCNVHLCFVPGQSGRHRNCFKKFHILSKN